MAKNREQIYDELLVIRCRQGDSRAFDELVARWQRRLWNYAFQVVRSEAAAWDILQETWLAVIKGLSKLQDATFFPQWIFRILNNKCADWLRKKHLHRKLNDDLTNQAMYESAVQKENHEEYLLHRAIPKLPADSRVLLSLRYGEGFEVNQIAEILRIPEGTVKSRLHRTVNKLRQKMGQKQNG